MGVYSELHHLPEIICISYVILEKNVKFFPMLNLSLPVRFKSKRDITSIEGKSGMEVDEKTEANSALSHSTLILEGRYRLLRLLHQRPRVNLYLAQRLSPSSPHDDRKGHHYYTRVGHRFVRPDHDITASEVSKTAYSSDDSCGHHGRGDHHEAEWLHKNDSHPLVAIRELVLNGLTPALRTIIEQATFEEFISPAMLGSPRLPGTGDRIYTEGDRHYLIMQSGHTGSQQPAHSTPLADLLNHPQWPLWLDISMALTWTIAIARLVARLHRLGAVLGDLDPATVLVDRDSAATWAPVLLISWPPAPQFWPQLPSSQDPAELYSQLFPIGQPEPTNPFIAPELLHGLHDQRSDIYSLGAIFYLLLTHYAPASATHRLDLLSTTLHAENSYKSLSLPEHSEHIELISPHHLNKHIPQALESIVLRTLALDPAERYTSVFELVEALEALL
jgi:Protein kinase domain